jgi:hypothetical protein
MFMKELLAEARHTRPAEIKATLIILNIIFLDPVDYYNCY